jgi:hypothetical protein
MHRFRSDGEKYLIRGRTGINKLRNEFSQGDFFLDEMISDNPYNKDDLRAR